MLNKLPRHMFTHGCSRLR